MRLLTKRLQEKSQEGFLQQSQVEVEEQGEPRTRGLVGVEDEELLKHIKMITDADEIYRSGQF